MIVSLSSTATLTKWLIFAVDGTLLGRLGERHAPRLGAPFNHPTDCAVAEDGEIYVSDGYGNTRVHRFSPEDKLLQSWGERGSGPSEFSTPYAVWVDHADRVVVADRENDRVQLFDREGRFLGAWGDIHHPMDMYEDATGRMFVIDRVPRLNMFAPKGRLEGCCRPAINNAHGVSGDAAGNIYLAEMMPSHITRLTPEAQPASTGITSPAAETLGDRRSENSVRIARRSRRRG